MFSQLPKRARLLEFSVLAAIFATLGFLLLDALKGLQDDAERVTVELTIRNMNSGLYLLQAERLASGQVGTLAELASQNPVAWLAAAPAGYIGEQECAKVITSGQWCWDKTLQTLYYQPRQKPWLKIGGNLPMLTWRLVSPHDAATFRPGGFRLQSQDQPLSQGY